MQRLEALLKIDERIAALESAKPEARPIWKNAALVAAYGSLIALVPALVTGVAGWFENHREFELAARKQEHERTLAYLGLAVDPGSTEAARAQVLRFLAAQDGDPVGVWARAELELVQGKIAELQTEKDVVTQELEEVQTKAQRAESEAAQLVAQAQDDPKAAKLAAAKTAEADHLHREVLRKRDRVDALATRVGDVPFEIVKLRAQGERTPAEVPVEPEPAPGPAVRLR